MSNAQFKVKLLLLKQKLIRALEWFLVEPPHPPWLADLFLWLLGLQGITVGSVTVWAVMFTVVISCFGIGHDQKLLDVTLQKTEKETCVRDKLSRTCKLP